MQVRFVQTRRQKNITLAHFMLLGEAKKKKNIQARQTTLIQNVNTQIYKDSSHPTVLTQEPDHLIPYYLTVRAATWHTHMNLYGLSKDMASSNY
jgi:hypothetical protein